MAKSDPVVGVEKVEKVKKDKPKPKVKPKAKPKAKDKK